MLTSLAPLNDFLYYGGPRASLLCLSLEEYADPESYAANLARRVAEARPVDDIHRIHRKLAAAGVSDPYGLRRIRVTAWRVFARLVLCLAGLAYLDPDLVDRFIRLNLGRTAGDVALAEKGPVPRPNVKWAVPGFPSYDPDTAFTRRTPALRAAFGELPLRFAVSFGRGTARCLGELFDLVPSEFRGQTAIWHEVHLPGTSPMTIARTATGITCARVGFYSYTRGMFTRAQIPVLAEALLELDGRGPLRLVGPH